MAQIQVTNLTFSYEGSADTVLENVSFNMDTGWKLGLIGRNGKGKTTLLRLLMGEYAFEGSITRGLRLDYFPYVVSGKDLERTADELTAVWKPQVESWQVLMQMNLLGIDAECLYRPFGTLSHGERTRVMLAVLFAAENEFLLIDEPTNHLDQAAREAVKAYLAGKKGFILVSHDRDLLDAVCDHVLVLNRKTVEVQAGNFSSWWENKERSDAFARAENEKHRKEIGRLKAAADRSGRWAEQSENSKIGFDPIKENDRSISTRSYIGAKTKKMQARVKAYEKRMSREIEEKEGLLQDIEQVADLKIHPLRFHKEILINARDMSLQYEGAPQPMFEGLRFQVRRGERIVLSGGNGCGKSSLLRAVMGKINAPAVPWGGGGSMTGMNYGGMPDARSGRLARGEVKPGSGEIVRDGLEPGYGETVRGGLGPGYGRIGLGRSDAESGLIIRGTLEVASGLIISYVSQDTSFLSGSLKSFCEARGLDESLFLAVLRQMDLGREQFAKNMEDFSEGQKKKVLISASLITPAHLYIWDEPLNYVDVFSRMQIEKLILAYEPTMLLVEHDVRFRERVATAVTDL